MVDDCLQCLACITLAPETSADTVLDLGSSAVLIYSAKGDLSDTAIAFPLYHRPAVKGRALIACNPLLQQFLHRFHGFIGRLTVFPLHIGVCSPQFQQIGSICHGKPPQNQPFCFDFLRTTVVHLLHLFSHDSRCSMLLQPCFSIEKAPFRALLGGAVYFFTGPKVPAAASILNRRPMGRDILGWQWPQTTPEMVGLPAGAISS